MRTAALHQARNLAGWALVAVVVFLAWPAQLGGNLSLVVVSGHSMDGTYRTGDLLLTWPQDSYEKGDIVVYRVPEGDPASGLRVVHRIVTADDGHFITQGDNRDTPDIWSLTAADMEGSPSFRVPVGGLALRWLLSPFALALVSAVCIYLVVVGKDSEADDEGASGSDSEAAREPDAVVPR
ncbi:MAG: signal peptidase [Actinomycetota bacterium]|jgi:signal peptidase|nr:signal peptidase [Actinomycetota bacterium]